MGSGKGSGEGLGCCGGLTKLLMFIFNIVFWITGAALLGVGIWVKVDKVIAQNLSKVIPGNYLEVIAIVLIVLGSLIFVIGFCGCCGACKESVCLLAIYIALMVVIVLAEITVGVAAYVLRGSIESSLGGALKGQVERDYKFDNGIGLTWNFLQQNFECCGSDGPIDYKNSTWYKTSGVAEFVPVTCCVPTSKASDPQKTQAKNPAACQQDAKNIYDGFQATSTGGVFTGGCYPQLIDFIKKYSVYILAAAAAIAAVQIIGIGFASYLVHKIKKSKEEEEGMEMGKTGASNKGMV